VLFVKEAKRSRGGSQTARRMSDSTEAEMEAILELTNLVVEEMAEEPILADFLNDIVIEAAVEVQGGLDSERERRKLEIEEEKARLEQERKEQKARMELTVDTTPQSGLGAEGKCLCKSEDRKSPGMQLKEAADRYVAQVEGMKEELIQLRNHRDSIMREINTLSTEVQVQKTKASQAQTDLAEGERELEQARLDMFLSLQSLGCEVMVTIDQNESLSAIKEDGEEEEAEHDPSGRVPRDGSFVSPVQRLADDLSRQYHFVVNNFCGTSTANKVREEVLSLKNGNMLRPGLVAGGRVGKGERVVNRDIRSDELAFYAAGTLSYYDTATPNSAGDEKEIVLHSVDALLKEIDAFIKKLLPKVSELRDKHTVLLRSKAMLTCYPGNGSKYTRHVDNPNENGRILTVIYYLNASYNKETDGGEIMLHIPDGSSEKEFIVEPVADRLLVFWSDMRVPHQVLPSHAGRMAVTVWYTDAREKMKAMESS